MRRENQSKKQCPPAHHDDDAEDRGAQRYSNDETFSDPD
jgi:hypothetical protein